MSELEPETAVPGELPQDPVVDLDTSSAEQPPSVVETDSPVVDIPEVPLLRLLRVDRVLSLLEYYPHQPHLEVKLCRLVQHRDTRSRCYFRIQRQEIFNCLMTCVTMLIY